MPGFPCRTSWPRTEDQAHTTGPGTGGCRRDLAADECHAVADLHRSLRHSN
jgi:hypothetical protein